MTHVHESACLGPRFLRLGQVQVHFVAVEIRIVGCAATLVKSDNVVQLLTALNFRTELV